MQNLILSLMQQYGYLGIALLIAIENLFPPIPSELILTFGGFLATCTSLNLWLVILSATAGSLLGAILLYGAGCLLTQKQVKHLLSGRLGKFLCLRPSHVDQAVDWFHRTGICAVLLCRFIPVVRSLISIPAGFSRIPLPPFLLLTALGSFLWNAVLVWVGVAASESLPLVLERLSAFSNAGKGGLLLLGAAALLWWFRKHPKY